MAGKHIIINKALKQLKRKEQEYEELRQYHNKCCEENAKKLEEWLKKYNQVSREFYSGKYCNKENCSLLKAKEKEYEELKKQRQADKGLITSTGKMNYQLIQEYDKLKTEKTESIEQLEFVRTLNTVQEAEIRKLSKTLAEIKEFIQSDYCTEIASCEFCAEAGNCLNRKILQKINECEVENE